MRIVGTVVEPDGRPVAGAELVLSDTIAGLTMSTTADSQGRFEIPFTRGGSFEISAERMGYSRVLSALACFDGEELLVQIVLSVSPVEITGLDITARPVPAAAELNFRGFEARRAHQPGFFIAEDEIVRRSPTRMTDLVGRAPGATVLRLGGRAVDVTLVRGQGSSFRGLGTCLPSIYLDGLRVREGGPQEGDIRKATFTLLNDLIQPEEVTGIEVYTGLGGLPAVFRGTGASCGVVAIWTKRQTHPTGLFPPIPDPPRRRFEVHCSCLMRPGLPSPQC
jgi:hypothetical protein